MRIFVPFKKKKDMVQPTLQVEPTYTLRYHLRNTRPVELSEFTASLQAIHSEYQAFARERGLSGYDVKLHVHHIENGSLIIDMAEYATAGVLPFIGEVVTVVEFAKLIKDVISWKLEGWGKSITKRTLENCSNMVQPVAVDPLSTLDLSVLKGSNTFKDCVFQIGNQEANAFQNHARRAIKSMKEEIPANEVIERVLLKIHQMKAGSASEKADRGIIESIADDAKKLLLDDEVKQILVYGEENPFTKLYYVDVIPMASSGRIVAYRVIKVHESFDING